MTPKTPVVILSFLIYFLLSTTLSAQIRSVIQSLDSSRALVEWTNTKTETGTEAYFISSEIPDQGPAPFLLFAVQWRGEHGNLAIRFSEDSTKWDAFQLLQVDPHTPFTDGFYSDLYDAPASAKYFQLRVEGVANLSESLLSTIYFCNPGFSDNLSKVSAFNRNDSLPCPQPSVLTRQEWCPSGNCQPDPTPVLTAATHLIIHHSAGVNTSSDWPAVVRGIWDFHVNVNGWDDIGYNWLIDPKGQVYEGRADSLQGAHFCGFNSQTTGICMLGNFQNVGPSGDSKRSLVELLAWKCGTYDLDPMGMDYHNASMLTLNVISGHRDGCSTSCPGNQFYPLLPLIRNATQSYIEDDCYLAGVDDVVSNPFISVFPNPVIEEIRLQRGLESIEIQWDYSIFNVATGQIVEKGKWPAGMESKTINMEAYRQGVYVLNCREEGSGKFFRKLLVKASY